MGTAFLVQVYESLGQNVVLSSLRELYQLSRDTPYPVTEEDVYQVFLSNTPPEQHDQFRDLYGSLHGGPVPDP